MNLKRAAWYWLVLLALLSMLFGMFACSNDDDGGGDSSAVYAMTNAADGNEILVYNRAEDGALTFSGAFSTNGLGSGLNNNDSNLGDALGSQNPLIVSPNGQFLFATNAGSNGIAVFQINGLDLFLVDNVDSGGAFPASLTANGNRLYVLNSGLDGNITGFTFSDNGALTPIPDSTRSLNAGAVPPCVDPFDTNLCGANPPFFLVSPAVVEFTPDGSALVVTVKGTDEIHVFAVDANGLPSAAPVTTISNGDTPFGVTFDAAGHLIVAEAFGSSPVVPAPNASAVSSYTIAADGTLQVVSGSIDNGQTATCWMAATATLPFVYATNNVSNNITSYQVDAAGNLTLLNAIAYQAADGTAPVDLVVTSDDRFLYTTNGGSGTVSTFEINQQDGSLTFLGDVGGLPAGVAVGIAVR